MKAAPGPSSSLSERLKWVYADRLGISGRALARKAKLKNDSHVSVIVKTGTADLQTLELLAVAGDVDRDWLQTGRGSPERRRGVADKTAFWTAYQWFTENLPVMKAFQQQPWTYDDLLYLKSNPSLAGGPGGTKVRTAKDVHGILQRRHQGGAARMISDAEIERKLDEITRSEDDDS